MTQYIYPQNLKATANLWLWSLRDFVISCVGLLISVLALTQLCLILPFALTVSYVFLSIRLEEIAVLSHANVEQKEYHLRQLLSFLPELEFVCLDSCERFDDNKRFLKQRIAEEENPSVRAVLEQEIGFLESKQIEMSTARQFLFVWRFTRGEKPEQVFQDANEVGRKIVENGFEVRPMEKDDLKRVLGLYFGTSMTGEAVEDVDGAQNFNLDRRQSY